MPAATFDGPNLTILLPPPVAGLLTMDVQQDIYSDWKVWVKDTGHLYEPAFDITGGDPATETDNVAGYYFLRNDLGWRIMPTEEDQEITYVGNLYPRAADQAMFMDTVGPFTVVHNIERSINSLKANGTNLTTTGIFLELL